MTHSTKAARHAARGTPTPTPRQLLAFRAQLEEQRTFRLDQLEELRAIDPDHSSELTEVTTVIAAGARAALHDVLSALRRMDAGTYGSCTECGCDLPLERLEVLPQVGQCLECSRAAAARAAR